MSTTIEMLRAQCRIDIDDTTEDEVLTLYYGAARRKAENFINRHLYEEEVPETDPDGLVIAGMKTEKSRQTQQKPASHLALHR